MPDSIPTLHVGSGGFGGNVASPAFAGHGRSSVELLERSLQFFGAGLAHPEDELPAALDQAACVIQQYTSDSLPGRPGKVFVQAPPCGQRVQVVGQQSRPTPSGICPETTARHGADGEAVLERIMGSLGVAATTVERCTTTCTDFGLGPSPSFRLSTGAGMLAISMRMAQVGLLSM